MDILALATDVAPIIIAQFKDLCDIEHPQMTNVDGQMVETGSPNLVLANVKCAFEPWRKHSDQIFHLPESGLMSGSVTHTLLMEAIAVTLAIDEKYRLRIHARAGRAELILLQPMRLDESLSPLIIIGATMRNQ